MLNVALCLQDIVRWCCESSFVHPNQRDHAGFTPLLDCCAHSRDTASIHLLLTHGADVNVASYAEGLRPVHAAVRGNDVQLVRLLLACGADPTLPTHRGATLWQLASSHDMTDFLAGTNSYIKANTQP